jgi:hypothetical protein
MTSALVMAVLDTAINAEPSVPSLGRPLYGGAWVAGSSPAMTKTATMAVPS